MGKYSVVVWNKKEFFVCLHDCFFLTTLAVSVGTQVFSSGVFIPRLIHWTKIERPVQEKITGTLTFTVTVGDKGEVRGISLKNTSDLTPQNEAWIRKIQKEVKGHWKYEPKIKFAMYYMMTVDLLITDEDFRPLKPRR